MFVSDLNVSVIRVILGIIRYSDIEADSEVNTASLSFLFCNNELKRRRTRGYLYPYLPLFPVEVNMPHSQRLFSSVLGQFDSELAVIFVYLRAEGPQGHS